MKMLRWLPLIITCVQCCQAQQTPLKLGAVINSVINKTPYLITIRSPYKRQLVIEPHQTRTELNFAIPFATSLKHAVTSIYLNDATHAQMMLELILNPSEEMPGIRLREFVAKLTMQYPNKFAHGAWRQGAKYSGHFFSSGNYAYLFKIDLIFDGAQLQGTEIKSTISGQQAR
ncbi:hypothetical protein Noda2021_06050 [Candidatus Dependentiae bacterium Noda2021]|nr:hypothetical protein Noda2021_06050 [Candidatus Dependentiae bacterium Noda2021]